MEVLDKETGSDHGNQRGKFVNIKAVRYWASDEMFCSWLLGNILCVQALKLVSYSEI